MNRSIVAAGALIALSAASAHAADVYIDIGEATQTLNEWSRQTNVQVLFDFKLMRGVYTNRTTCDCTATESLQQLIRHLGLQYEFVNPRTVAITWPFVVAPSMRYPSPEEYQGWFDRAELEQPAKSYGYDQDIRAGQIRVVYPGEQNAEDTDLDSRNSAGGGDLDLRATGTRPEGRAPVVHVPYSGGEEAASVDCGSGGTRRGGTHLAGIS